MTVRTEKRQYTMTTRTSYLDTVSGASWENPAVIQKVNSLSWTTDESKSGVKNPSWRHQVANHIEASTGFFARRRTVNANAGSAKSQYTDNVGNLKITTKTELNGFFPVSLEFFSPDPTVATRAANDARDKAYAKIKSLQTPANGGVFLGELREAVHMIRNPAAGLSRLIMGEQYSSTKKNLWAASKPNPKRRKSRNPTKKDIKRSVSGAMADSWLENSFGWQPFISDIKSGAVALAKLNVDPEFLPFRVRGSASGKPVIINNGVWGISGFISYDETLVKTTESSKQYYGEVRNKVGGEGTGLIKAAGTINRYADAFGLTARDFIPTVWELIPYSFLVDYFSNVGDVLSQSFVDMGSLVRLSSTTVHKGVTKAHETGFRGSNPTITASGSMPVVTIIDKTVNRTPGFDLVPASLRFELPGISSRKWANMGALITTQWTGMGQKLSKRL